MTRIAVALLVAGSVLGIGPCDTPTGAKDRVLAGTWGGDNAGVIVTDTSAHVHIGCTVGDVHQPLETDPEGRFDVPGLYNITAYPVYRGPDHPARFTGRIDGKVMTLTVHGGRARSGAGPVREGAADGPVPDLPGARGAALSVDTPISDPGESRPKPFSHNVLTGS